MGSSLTRSVLKGSALGLMGAGLAIPVALISTPLFLSGLGVEGFGHWGLLQGFFAGLNLLSVGTTDATMYFVARDHAESGASAAQARNRALALVVILGCLVGGLLLATGPIYGLGALLRLPEAERADFERLLLPGAALWCCQFWCFWLQLLPRARHEYGVLTWNQITVTVLAPLLGWIGLRLSGGDARWFLLGQAGAWLLGSISLHAWNFRHSVPLDLRPSFDPAVLAEVAQYARWAFVFMLSVVLLNSTDRLLLAGLGAQALAGYSAASSLTQRVYSVTGLMTASLLPALARIKEGVELERLQRAFSVSLRALGFFWAALLLPLAAWGDHFMSVWLKNPELAAAAYPALLLLCCGAYFGALASGCHAALLGSNRPRLAAVTGLAGAALGLGLAIPAVNHWGVAGAAVLGLAGNALAFLLRAAIMEKARFGRSLTPLLIETSLGVALLGGAYGALRLTAPYLENAGLMGTVSVMLISAAVLMLLGLGMDMLLSKLRGLVSLLGTLESLRVPA